MAVNHDGDSDSAGVITGQLLGVQYGAAAIPSRWYERLEMRGVSVLLRTLTGCRGNSAGCRVSLMQSFPTTIQAIDDGGTLERLRALIDPQMLRRTKQEVAKDLPDKIEGAQWRTFTMHGLQRNLYLSEIAKYSQKQH